MTFKLPDQFEIEPTVFYSGSYTDPIFDGSFLAGTRRIVARHTSGSNELLYALYYSDFADYSGSNRTRSLGTSLRFRQFTSTTERYQDTILPDILSAFYSNGGIPVFALAEFGASPIILTEADADVLIPNTAVGKLVFTTYGTTASYGDGTPVSDPVWFASFPFQSRYRNIQRTLTPGFYKSNILCPATESRNLSTGILEYGTHNSYPSTSLATAEVIIPLLWTAGTIVGSGSTQPVRFTLIDVSGSVNASEQFLGAGLNAYPPASTGLFGTSKGTKRPRQKQLTKFFFGFGDNYQGVPITQAVSSSYHYSTIGVINGFYVSSVDIRGWKYGVASGFPYYSNCIWRANRYGQFRDMLEQRKYTKFFDADGFTADGRNRGKKGASSAVVTVRFVSGSQAAITASNPSTLNPNDSGIYDFEAKSGQPFSDV